MATNEEMKKRFGLLADAVRYSTTKEKAIGVLEMFDLNVRADQSRKDTDERVQSVAAARAEGFKEGYKEGRRAAAEQTRRELGEVILTLKEKYDVGTLKEAVVALKKKYDEVIATSCETKG